MKIQLMVSQPLKTRSKVCLLLKGKITLLNLQLRLPLTSGAEPWQARGRLLRLSCQYIVQQGIEIEFIGRQLTLPAHVAEQILNLNIALQ